MTSSYGPPYLIKVTNTELFRRFAEKICGVGGNDNVRKENFKSDYEYLLRSPDATYNELQFLKMMSDKKIGLGMTLFRGNNDCNQWSKLSLFMGNEVRSQPCN